MRKTFAVLGVAVLVLTGCAQAGPGADPADPATAPTAAPATAAPAPTTKTGVTLGNYVGKNLKEVRDQLEALGLKHEAKSLDGKSVILASNWTVAAQEPAAGAQAEPGSTVSLKVNKPGSTPAANPECLPADKAAAAIAKRLDPAVTFTGKSSAVKSKDFENLYVVAVGAKVENTTKYDLLVFIVDDLGKPTNIRSENVTSELYSAWPLDTETAASGGYRSYHGHDEVLGCLRAQK